MLQKAPEVVEDVKIPNSFKTCLSLLCAFPVLVDHRHKERRLRLHVDLVSVGAVGKEDLDSLHSAGYN